MSCRECDSSGYCGWCGGTGRERLASLCRSCFGSGRCLACGSQPTTTDHSPSAVSIIPECVGRNGRITFEVGEKERFTARFLDGHGNSLDNVRVSWAVGDRKVAHVFAERNAAFVQSKEIGQTLLTVSSGSKSATTEIESVAAFSGEWLGEQVTERDDGSTDVSPISLSLRKRNRTGQYLGNYRWLDREPEPAILIPSLRIKGTVSGNLMTFTIPSPFESGEGQMVLWGDTIIGEIVMSDGPRRRFTLSR